MATTIGKLNFMVTADANGVRTGLLVGEQALSGFAARITSIYQSIAAQLQLNPVSQFFGWGVRLAAEGQQAETGFRVFLGSAEKARDLLTEIRQFALESPLNSSDLQSSANMLLGYGVAADSVMPSLRMLGDISRGNAQRLDLLSLAFGQVAAKGRLQGQELRQLTEQGFNPLQIISEKTGISMGVLLKKMEDGEITFGMVEEAMRMATSEGGRFFGMMNEQSQTLAGRWENLKESAGVLAREIGEGLTPSLMKLIEQGKGVIDWFRDLDVTTIRNVANLGAMTLAFSAALNLVPRIIAGVTSIVKALRAMATAESIAQALSGPGGWASLAAGLVAAAAAGYAVNAMFDSMEATIPKVEDAASGAATEVSTMFDALKGDAGESLDSLKERLHAIRDEAREAKQRFQEMIRAVESRRSNSFTAAADRFTTAGQQAIASGALERVIQEEIAKLRSEQAASLRRLEEQEKKVERAIKEKGGVKEVKF